MNLSVVIPSYNRRSSLFDLLHDLRQQRDVVFEVIVVDDGSTDGTRAAIRAEFPEVVLLENEQNSGPAITRNRGVRAARAPLIVGFDSDVRLPDPLLLKAVQDHFRDLPAVTGFAFRLLDGGSSRDDARRWFHPLPLATYADKTFATSYFSGTAYAFRRTAMIEAGLYPEDIFMHYEEVELAFRILDRGGTILYAPRLVVHHHENRVSHRSQVDAFYRPRNQVLLALGCLPWRRAFAYALPRLGYQFLVSIRHRHVGSFFRAIRSAAQLAPHRLRTRRPLRPETMERLRLMEMRARALKTAHA